VSPFLQLFYFTSGLGSFIAPFFVEPFLVKVKSSSPVTNTSHANITPNDLQLVFPYSFAAFMLFVASASLFMTWKISPILEEHPSRRLPVNSTERSDVVKKDKNHVAWFNFYKFVVIVLSLIYANVYYGLFVTVGSFLVSYAAKSDMSLTKTDGARLTSLFWGAFSFWRLGTLFYQQYLGNGKIIIMSLFLSLIGTVILPFAHSSIICLWVSVAIIGIGISPVWPALFGYLEQYFTVSSKVSSAMCISAQFGEFVFPLIVSYFLEQVPQVFLWVSMFCTISISVAIGSVMIIANYKLHTQE
jgi:fucose permease